MKIYPHKDFLNVLNLGGVKKAAELATKNVTRGNIFRTLDSNLTFEDRPGVQVKPRFLLDLALLVLQAPCHSSYGIHDSEVDSPV